jgi:hypothetical protein
VTSLPRAEVDPNLDFSRQRITKLAWAGLEGARGRDAMAFIRDFELGQKDYAELSVLIDKLDDPQLAACVWVKVGQRCIA